MRALSPADVADAGLVRLGAGIRAPLGNRPGRPISLADRPAAAAPPAGAPRPVAAAKSVADAGRSRA